jgi:plasmid stability protein
MPDILIRNLDDQTVKRLKQRAKQNHRSLQSEAKLLLERGAGLSIGDAIAEARNIRNKLGKRFTDSSRLITKDRER